MQDEYEWVIWRINARNEAAIIMAFSDILQENSVS